MKFILPFRLVICSKVSLHVLGFEIKSESVVGVAIKLARKLEKEETLKRNHYFVVNQLCIQYTTRRVNKLDYIAFYDGHRSTERPSTIVGIGTSFKNQNRGAQPAWQMTMDGSSPSMLPIHVRRDYNFQLETNRVRLVNSLAAAVAGPTNTMTNMSN